MRDVNATSSVFERWIIGLLGGLLAAVIVAWVVGGNLLQINFILGAFALALLAVLCCAAWRHGFRWFFTRRALRFYAWLVVGIISVIVVFYAEESWRGKRAWVALQREAHARGESLELSSVFPPPVPEEENFALAPGVPKLLGYAKGEVRSGSHNDPESLPFYLGRRHPDYPGAANWAFGQTTDLGVWQKYFRQHPLKYIKVPSPFLPAPDFLAFHNRETFPVAPAPQTPAADVLLALSRYDSALGVLRAANQRPKTRYPLAYEEGMGALAWPNSFPLPDFPAAAQVLCLRAVAELNQCRGEAALEDTLLGLRLANSLREQPYQYFHDVRAEMLMFCLQPVWEGLVQHCWDEPQLAVLQQQFAGMDLLAEFQVAVRGQTFVFMNLADQLQAFFENRRSFWGHELSSLEGSKRLAVWLFRILYPRGWFYQDKVWMYRFYERRADVFKALDLANGRQWWKAQMLDVTDPLFLTFMIPKLRQTFHVSMEEALFLQTACQEAVVACALERYRLAHGRYPDSLEALVPAWLKQVPADLLDPKGGRLRYRREGEGGFVLYSIGLNRTDDQGKPGSAKRDGRAEQATFPRLDEGDWVWRQPGR